MHIRDVRENEKEEEIDIVICLVKIACCRVCTYYHTITTRQRMMYEAGAGDRVGQKSSVRHRVRLN